MFVDNLLTVGKYDPSEWQVINNIISYFGNASGLQVNQPRSTVILSDLEAAEIMGIANIFRVKSSHMGNGFTYLGSFLKHNGYKIKDRD